MKVTCFDDLDEHLENDFTWRVKEISSITTSAQLAETKDKPAVMRSAIPMFYAHWEGYIKSSSDKYLEYISSKRIKYKHLHANLFYLCSEGLLREAGDSSVKRKIEILWDIISSTEKTNKHRHNTKIKTKSNLRWEVLEEICTILGLDAAVFDNEEEYINKKLCDRRNFIAHGQEVYFDISDIIEMKDKTVSLMRTYKNLIINSALTEKYKLPQNSQTISKK